MGFGHNIVQLASHFVIRTSGHRDRTHADGNSQHKQEIKP